MQQFVLLCKPMFKVPNNSLSAMRNFVSTELQASYGEHESKSLFRIACEAYLNIPYNKPLPNIALSESEILKFFGLIKRLKKNEPIQYVLGYTEFYGLKISVDSSVLIPRPETEELVHLAIKELNSHDSPMVLDLCTGSGCIALAVKANVARANVSAIEWSGSALIKAKQNAAELKLDVNFYKADALDINQLKNIFAEKSIHLLLSNPPYIGPEEMLNMEANVLEYEPHMALFTPENKALIFYEKIAQFAQWSLQTEGVLLVEINERYSNEVCAIFVQEGLKNVSAIKDINGKFRIVKAIKA